MTSATNIHCRCSENVLGYLLIQANRLHNCLFPTCRFPELTRKFTDCLADHGLVQLITNHTRSKNVLDLFIINNDSLIRKTQVIPGISDHGAVFVEGNIKATINKQKRRMVPLNRKADWDSLKEHMSKSVDSVVHSSNCDLSIDDLWSSLREELTSGIKPFIPHRFTSSRNGLSYVSPSLKRLMRKRDKLQARKDPRYKTIKHEVQKKLRATYWQLMRKRLFPQRTTMTRWELTNVFEACLSTPKKLRATYWQLMRNKRLFPQRTTKNRWELTNVFEACLSTPNLTARGYHL